MKTVVTGGGTLATSARRIAFAIAVAMTTLGASADYSFFLDADGKPLAGNPVAEARAAAAVSVGKSSGISLETRIRSIMKSIGQALNSNAWTGLMLIFR